MRMVAVGEKTRSLTQTLHPSILDDGGLEEAIDWYLSVFEKQTGIHVALEKSGVSRELNHELGDGMPIHVYRNSAGIPEQPRAAFAVDFGMGPVRFSRRAAGTERWKRNWRQPESQAKICGEWE